MEPGILIQLNSCPHLTNHRRFTLHHLAVWDGPALALRNSFEDITLHHPVSAFGQSESRLFGPSVRGFGKALMVSDHPVLKSCGQALLAGISEAG